MRKKVELKSHSVRLSFEIIYNHTNDNYSGFEPFESILPDLDAIIPNGSKVGEDLYKKASKLRIIAMPGSGTDRFDLTKAKDYGIRIASTRGANANAVAEMIVGIVICLLRDIIPLNAEVKRGQWSFHIGKELLGKKVGLIGFGVVAQAVAQKLASFQPEISACDLYPNEMRAAELGVILKRQEDIIRDSDIISVHVPGTPDNVHLCNADMFGRMKDDVYFINMSRGAL